MNEWLLQLHMSLASFFVKQIVNIRDRAYRPAVADLHLWVEQHYPDAAVLLVPPDVNGAIPFWCYNLLVKRERLIVILEPSVRPTVCSPG